MFTLRNGLAAAALSIALSLPVAANAHPKLLSANPAANSVVAHPSRIELHFSERLIARFSGVDLAMTQMPGMKMNAPMKIGGVTTALSADGKTLVGGLPKPLSAGTYQLSWHVVSADTHRVNGSLTFRVR